MYDVFTVYPMVMGMRAVHSIGYTFPKPTGAALCPMPIAVRGFPASFTGCGATSNASYGDHPNWTQRDEDEAHSMLYKTELCRSWAETGSCNYGPKCQVRPSWRLPLAQLHHHPSHNETYRRMGQRVLKKGGAARKPLRRRDRPVCGRKSVRV